MKLSLFNVFNINLFNTCSTYNSSIVNGPVTDRKSLAESGNSITSNNFTEDECSMIQIECFFKLIEDNIIQEFLEFDHCFKLADKYLLSIVFVYFVRSRLPCPEYTRINFFAALYLAHDLEEDDEDQKCHIMRWGLAGSHKDDINYFLEKRDSLWMAMEYRACVSLHCCLQIMKLTPNSPLWQRNRSPVHSGAIRDYDIQEECVHCKPPNIRFYGSDGESEDSASSDNISSDEDDIDMPPLKRMRLIEE